MSKLKIKSNPEVKKVFDSYPEKYKKKLLGLRALIIETARGIEGIEEIEETLKWGEPSYLADKGSTVRIAWKDKSPETYSIYFKCTSKLVETFKKLYSDKFNFIGHREIAFKLNDSIHKKELSECIKATLSYHKVKQLPDLGMSA